MVWQCVVSNSNISISCTCLHQPPYPKWQLSGLFKVLKQYILGSQGELWHPNWEGSSLLHGVAFKFWECWEWGVIPAHQPKLTQLPNCCKCLMWQRKFEFASQDRHQVQATHSWLTPVTHWAYGSPLPSASLLHCHAASCCQLWPAPAPETLPLWPTGASPRWTSHLMGDLGSQRHLVEM